MVDDAKSFFSFCKRIDVRIQAKVDEQARYRELATRTTPSMSDMPGSGGDQNKIEYCITRICELEQEINKEIDLLIECRKVAMIILNKVGDARYKDIIVLRYLSGYTWEMVGYRMNYERTHLWRIHGYALVAAQKAIEEIRSKDCEEKRVIEAILGKMEHNGTSTCDNI